MNIEGFEISAPYNDRKHFPYGFHRSGEFTIAQADIIVNYGKILSQLEQGNKNAETIEEKNFVAVCKGEKVPESPIESTWYKYRSLLNKKHNVSPFGSNYKPEIEVEDDDDVDIDIEDNDDLDQLAG